MLEHRYTLAPMRAVNDFRYGPWRIARDPKPIPCRDFDWDWWHADYDGEGDPRAGNAPSMEDAIAQIHEHEDEAHGD